jgi:hypothetical protein
MFVRFRQQHHRLQASLIATRRVDGKVRHEHIASLGSVDVPPSIRHRLVFWSKLSVRLAQLDNRVNAEDQAKIYGAIHARISMVTPDEQRALQKENAEAEEKFWARIHDMHAGTVEDHKGLAVTVDGKISNGQAEMAKAADRRAAARTRHERLQRGEDVPGGLGKPFALEDVMRMLRDEFGWTARDSRHCRVVAAIGELGEEVFEEYVREVVATAHATFRHRAAEPDQEVSGSAPLGGASPLGRTE